MRSRYPLFGIFAALLSATACVPRYTQFHGETIVGVGEELNCPPPRPPPQRPRRRVTLGKERLEINEKIQFAVNQAVILPASSSLLDEIAQTLKEHPELPKIEVQGHSSSEGDRNKNKTLSQARAEAVVKALTDRGVKNEVLTPKGFGSENPVASNDTEEGREKNRRVEFVIVYPEGPGGPRGRRGGPEGRRPTDTEGATPRKDGAK
ncbi:OmpA family protein [Chondromyces crocatus]|uniref:OmpA-like domain-containing protein n=1 Tax=Chondromyces crocatus TaxID=52 RepID=A0A0K1EKE6_CHOCO|nr:OmpA family protein [Chondromyces crocatus]AKT41339.1 uncharacterized protein CMC5_055380 [Chondromyces crocatus]